jgi:hypothetical protein
MLLTYKELFDKYSSGPEIDDQIFSVTDELFVKTPTGLQRIEVVFKKQGVGIELEMDDGSKIRCEERHTVQTSNGLEYAKDALDVLDINNQAQKIINKTKTTDTEFYDIGIAAPHLYYDVNGFIHHNTFTIMKTVNEMGMVKGKDYVKLSGKASPIEIYKTLFMYRDGGLVIFDDLDSMWRNEDAANILKAALDTSPIREISWVSNQTVNVSKMDDARKQVLFKQIDAQLNSDVAPPLEDDDDDDDPDADETLKRRKRKKKDEPPSADPSKIKYPSMFDFKGRVVFISNLKKEEFDTAILSRSAKINMDLSPAQVLERMRKILPTLGGTDVSIELKEELLEQLLKLHGEGEITAVTMREFIKGLDIVRSGVPNWRDLVCYS